MNWERRRKKRKEWREEEGKNEEICMYGMGELDR